MGEITSVSVACFDGSGNLIGVVGSSVPLNWIPDFNSSTLLNLNPQCRPLSLTDQELQNLRGNDLCSTVPPISFFQSPAVQIVGIVVGVVIVVIVFIPMMCLCVQKVCCPRIGGVSMDTVEKQLDKGLSEGEQGGEENNDEEGVDLESSTGDNSSSSTSSLDNAFAS